MKRDTPGVKKKEKEKVLITARVGGESGKEGHLYEIKEGKRESVRTTELGRSYAEQSGGRGVRKNKRGRGPKDRV